MPFFEDPDAYFPVLEQFLKAQAPDGAAQSGAAAGPL
jgi:hypothetical protein